MLTYALAHAECGEQSHALGRAGIHVMRACSLTKP
jgi:hypothetical protein